MILAIDPGPTDSAWVFIDPDDCRPINFSKEPNAELSRLFYSFDYGDQVAIEMIASYGKAVGSDVFATVRWVGRFEQMSTQSNMTPLIIPRQKVTLHHCNKRSATDSQVGQALRDRFTPGQPNYGKGTKGEVGWFHQFHTDIWQAYALAVYVADTEAAQ